MILKQDDYVTLRGEKGPVGRILRIKTSTSVPMATVYWGTQDNKEATSKVPLGTLEPAPSVVTVTPPE